MRWYLFLIILAVSCLGIFFSPAISAQNQDYLISTRTISREQGLVSKHVQCGTQDSDGFVWLGTSQGLQRYDGQHFKLYTKERNGLQENNIVKVAEDVDHCLWILYGSPGAGKFLNGKCDVLNLKSHKLMPLSIYLDSKKISLPEGVIADVQKTTSNELIIKISAQNNLHDLWLFNASGLNRIFSGMHYFNVRDSVIIAGIPVGQIVEMNLKGKILSRKPLLVNDIHTYPIGQLPNGRTAFLEYRKKNMIISNIRCYETDYRTNRQTPIESFFKTTSGNLSDLYYSISYDANSAKFLVNFANGDQCLYDGKENIWFPKVQSNDHSGVSANIVFEYFTTHDQQNWICTNEGVQIFTVKKSKFRQLLSNKTISFTNQVDHQSRTIFEDSTGTYILCWKGLFHYRNPMVAEKPECLVDEKPFRFFDGFYFDGESFWIALDARTMLRYHRQTRKKEYIKVMDVPFVYSGIRTQSGRLLIGSNHGIFEFNGKTFQPAGYCDSASSQPFWTYKFFHAPDNHLYAVTSIGLLELNDRGCILKRYSAESKEPASRIPATQLHDVCVTRDGNFWLATNGNGIIRWNRKSNQFAQYTVAEGLSSNVVYGILEDKNGVLWISSDYGLMRFVPETGFVQTFTEADGISSNEFNRASFFKSVSGRMYFGGLNGVTVLNPTDFMAEKENDQVPLNLISFHRFSSTDNKLKDETLELLNAKQIILKPEDQFFTLEFQLLDFDPGHHQYAYMIEGVDKSWNFINENSIRISGLPYGHFTLHVKGQNKAGKWSSHQIRLPLLILKPYYRQTWFLVLVAFSLIVLVWLFFQWRTFRLRKANTLLEWKVRERTVLLENSIGEQEKLLAEKDVLLKEIHHRVKNNLQVISGLIELQSKSVSSEDLKTALMEGRNRVQSIALIHQNLYQNTDLGHIDMGKFVGELEKEVSMVFRRDHLQVTTLLESGDLILDIDTAVPLGLILNELFSNSYKYAFGNSAVGQIRVQFEKMQEGNFRLAYSDSGPGLPEAFDLKKSSTLGMQLISDLSRQIGGNFSYQKKENRFEIRFADKDTRKLQD